MIVKVCFVVVAFDESKVLSFLKESVEHGAEGIMMKLVGTDTRYEAGTRSHSWLKVKRDYVAGFADTIDVVPIGAWYGNGRKAQKSFLSPVLLAVYDDQEDVSLKAQMCHSVTFLHVHHCPLCYSIVAGLSIDQQMHELYR